MAESLEFSIDLPVSPERVYRAWLDGYEHSQFTGKRAKIDARVGGDYSTQDGFIQGKIESMTPFTRIVQTLRSEDFSAKDPDSKIELELTPTCLGAEINLIHTGIPAGEAQKYLQYWEKNVFKPLQDYFEKLVGGSAADQDG